MKRIAGFIKTSLIDWTGKISSVIFLSGCQFKCSFCHNSDLISLKEGKLNSKDLLNKIENNKWADGVVISGGEALYREDIIDLLKDLRGIGMKIKIDTNGFNYGLLDYVIEQGLVDYIAMDVKAALNEEGYLKATGRKHVYHDVIMSLDILAEADIDFELRTTMVPGIVTGKDLLYNVKYLPKGCKYYLQQFSQENVRDDSLKGARLYSKKQLQEFAAKLEKKGFKVGIRNV